MCCAPHVHTHITLFHTCVHMYLCCSCAFARTYNLFYYSCFVFSLPLRHSQAHDTINVFKSHIYQHPASTSALNITNRNHGSRANVNGWFDRFAICPMSDRNRIFKHFVLFCFVFSFVLLYFEAEEEEKNDGVCCFIFKVVALSGTTR